MCTCTFCHATLSISLVPFRFNGYQTLQGHKWINFQPFEFNFLLFIGFRGQLRNCQVRRVLTNVACFAKGIQSIGLKQPLPWLASQGDISNDLLSIHQDLATTGTLGSVMVSRNDYIIAQNVPHVKSYLGYSIIVFLDKTDNCCMRMRIIVCAFLFWKKIYIAYMLDMNHFQRIVNKPDQEIN